MRPRLPISAGEACRRSFKSMMVTNRPRTLTTPMTSLGARGTSVTGGSFKISRTSPLGTAYESPPSRKAKYSTRGPRSFSPRRPLDLFSGASRLAIRCYSYGGIATLHERLFDESGGVNDQRHALIAEFGGAGEALHLLQ